MSNETHETTSTPERLSADPVLTESSAEVDEWGEAGFDSDQADWWITYNFSAAEAKAWIEAGIITPRLAAAFYADDQSPDYAREILEENFGYSVWR
jgi:hypothetical protein